MPDVITLIHFEIFMIDFESLYLQIPLPSSL